MNKGNDIWKTGKGFLADVVLKIQLTTRLVSDQRVSTALKLIPIFCLVYLIVPFDLLIGPIDDAVVIYFGMDFFISLCPDDVVKEHLSKIQGGTITQDPDVIDVDFKDK